MPAGGITWDYIQYPLGFASLGHDVFYIEDTRLWPIYQDAASGDVSCAANVEHLAHVMSAFGLANRWAYRDEVTGQCFGMSSAAVDEACRTADVFVNVSCSTFLRDEYLSIPIRVLIDTDPMFTQIQHATQSGFTAGQTGIRGLVAGHTHHFTFGESVGAPDCRIPETGVEWHATRQPVCIEHWPVTPLPAGGGAKFTTIMNWTAGRPLLYEGECWGQKDVEFLRLLDLPRRTRAHLAVVVGQTTGEPFPVERATSAGWQVLDPATSAEDWLTYRNFIQSSAGEFSVAKETYVKARTGWFSCRSACYLASGRPVVTQDTGWSLHIPSGRGLIGFTTRDEAVAGLEEVASDPARHGESARAIAEEFFDAQHVLGDLLAQVTTG
ncbi:MAG: glycosyltransferase family 1 protein [Gemmatimonadaceae bacterium]|nr:glycosyltransferase family 1 protein [Gemmatimonadaceae bacterium]